MPEKIPPENGSDNTTQQQSDRPAWIYYVIMLAIAAIPLLVVGWYALSKFDGVFERYVTEHAMERMSDDEKEKLYAILAKESPGMFEAIPEPLVGRVLKKTSRKNLNALK